MYICENFLQMLVSVLWVSDVWYVQVGAVDAPVWWEVLHRVVLDVSLHGHQAAAVLPADGALVRRSSTVGPQVLDHSWVVPWTLTTEAALERFFPGVNTVVCVQLMLQTKFLGTVLALVWFFYPVVLSMWLWITSTSISSTESATCTGLIWWCGRGPPRYWIFQEIWTAALTAFNRLRGSFVHIKATVKKKLMKRPS